MLRTLRRLIRVFDDNGVVYMIIGGYALPFYGRLRTTVDLDLAVAIRSRSEFDQLLIILKADDFQATLASPNNPLIVVVDRKEQVEFEIWTKPDGIFFDDETINRRRKAHLGEGVDAWIVSPEDFIVTKLARADRGVVDEQDVKSVLEIQKNKLDWVYLHKRAKDAEVLTILKTIQEA